MKNFCINFFKYSTVGLIIIFLIAFWIEPLQGDLTRIGNWTERDFGPNKEQPAVLVKMTGKSLQSADIKVLGDSFSKENLWQSTLSEKTNQSVKTYSYNENCIFDWINEVTSDLETKIIIIQTVERAFLDRFKKLENCKNNKSKPLEKNEVLYENKRNKIQFNINLKYIILSIYNTARLNLLNENIINDLKVINIKLEKNCAIFSNKRNDRLLYYNEDNLKKNWHVQELNEAISNVLYIQEKIIKSGKEFIFLVAPDKSSVYNNCIFKSHLTPKFIQLNELLINNGIKTPDTFKLFSKQILIITDLYDPNNTHWSIAGYTLAGEIISDYIKNK